MAPFLTLVSPENLDGVELSLVPDGHSAVRPFKEALMEDGIPMTSFAVEYVHTEHDRLVVLEVQITQDPLAMGPATTAVFDDTCGNLIQIAHKN